MKPMQFVLMLCIRLVPTMPPEKPICRSLTSQSIHVSWDLPPPTGRNGKIQGFKVSYQPAEDWFGKFI